MDSARFITINLVFVLLAPAAAMAQDRGVSIPDVFTPNPADTFVATEVTSALRIAGGMTPNWRPSTADVPLAELMRACGATLEVDPDLGCMGRMVVTRDPSMEGGLALFAFMDRVGEANGFRIILVLYDMGAGQVVQQIEAAVERIMAPALRNRMAAEWIRQLTAPPATHVAEVDPPPEREPDPPVVAEPEPEPEPEPVTAPVPEPRRVTDTTVTDSIGWILVGTAAASAIAAGITGWLLLSLNEDARYNAYRGSWDASRFPDICDVAEGDASADGRYALDVCNRGATYEILTHVLWAASGTLAFAGMIFIIWHPGAPSHEVAPTVRLAPILGPTQAGLDFTVEF